MRSAILLIIGLAVGMLGGIYAINALHQHNPVPQAVMVMLQYHYSELARQAQKPSCPAQDHSMQWEQLTLAARNIDSVFTGYEGDFAHRAATLRESIAHAAAQPISDCATLRQQLTTINQACGACHQRYR